jgi:hypothetical protein
MRRLCLSLPLLLALFALPRPAPAFCGFYVARADAKLFNRASRVVLVRDEDRTVLTMANDFRGDPKEFAVVVPVPTFLARQQIHVGDPKLLDHLDAYTAPRLVEYFDPDPCAVREGSSLALDAAVPKAAGASQRKEGRGVTVEARYTVGEYDIVILSAKESRGLEIWLRENGYRIPAGAARVLGGYIKQGMRFFVARVNLAEQARLGFSYLRPLQVAYESPKFMLPVRLGMINADGPQELFLYTLTRRGRVETTNYRTVRLPSEMEVPLFVKDEFTEFYRAMFTEQVRRERMSAVFLEYAWDMAWCDPCAADPLSPDELRGLGVFWLDEQGSPSPASELFVTRLHLRYDEAHFPEDLVFQQTADRSNFQGRYVLRHPFRGEVSCGVQASYRSEVRERQEREAKTLAELTGWRVAEIRKKMKLGAPDTRKWYEKLWSTLLPPAGPTLSFRGPQARGIW